MKALILAGGKGTRMNADVPKSLVLVKGKTILEHILDPLIEYNINDMIFLTGYGSKQIEDFLHEKYSCLNSKIIQDPPEHRGSYICSLARIKEFIDDDLIFLHGDMIYDKSLLKRMLDSKERNLVTTHIDPYCESKDFKAEVNNGRITRISVNVKGHLLMPFFKFSKESFLTWIDSMKEMIDEGGMNLHAEEAIAKYSNKINLKPLFYNQELCMELDNGDDIRKAESIIEKNY